MINRQTKLLLALLSTIVWLQGHAVEGAYRFEFKLEEIIVPSTNADSAAATADGSTRRRTTTTMADSITTDESETTTECELCSPGDLIKTTECFLEGMKQLDPELQEPGLLEGRIRDLRGLNERICHDTGVHGPWAVRVDAIDWTRVDRNNFNFESFWGEPSLEGNGFPTKNLRCSADDGPNAFPAPLGEEDQNERRLDEETVCPPACYEGHGLYYDCWDCYTRRRNLRQLSPQMVDIKKMQLAVNTAYNVCLLKDIPCMVCSSAKLCVINADGDKLCAEPSCHGDAEGCPESL